MCVVQPGVSVGSGTPLSCHLVHYHLHLQVKDSCYAVHIVGRVSSSCYFSFSIKAATWPKLQKICKCFHLMIGRLCMVFLLIFMQQKYLGGGGGGGGGAPQGATMWIHSLPVKSRKRLAFNIMCLAATHVHDVTDLAKMAALMAGYFMTLDINLKWSRS